MTSAEIRQQFLDFFAGKDHAVVPSSPVVPSDDPTLMFTNAGMNQFKDVFLGSGTRPYRRAADSQKCIRAGGKHNDLDDVGQDTYHHTFFEMLGNWSFGDYFKREAIQWAWELLTEVWGIDKARLHATFFEGDAAEGLEPDEEAARLWREVTDIDPSHVHPGDKKDNFWEMGDTGPCGPCSEIHVDLTPDKSGRSLVNAGDPRVIELWNLVFIQYNRGGDGRLTPLPAKHVDTGMGFERLCAFLQGKPGNYDTDVFTPIFSAIQQRTGAPDYKGTLPASEPRPSASGLSEPRPLGSGQAAASPSGSVIRDSQIMIDVSYRVIADHLRCLTFALTDGAVPSNEGRGYVLRRVLRRAVRYGRQYFDMHEPFLCDLVAPLVAHMGDAFPELRAAHSGRNVQHVTDIIRDEEESFGRTLDRGIRLFEEAAAFALGRTIADDRQTELRGVQPTDEARSGSFLDLRTERWMAVFRGGDEAHFGYVDQDEIRRHTTRTPAISGEEAYELHTTYGFPVDLTQQMAQERGMAVDIECFEHLMEQGRERDRSAGRDNDAFDLNLRTAPPSTDDSPKYAGAPTEATLIGYVRDGEYLKDGEVPRDARVALVLDRTNFYAEQGGQVADTGRICGIEIAPIDEEQSVFAVEDTQPFGGCVLHIGRLGASGVPLRVGQRVRAVIDRDDRPRTMKNHTATHLLNWALREVLGEGVQQKGSLVDAEKTRFDFSHPKPMTPAELARVEKLVNEKISAELPVYTKDVEQAEARKIKTLRAVFGEKYAERVRVVSAGADIDAMLADPDNAEWMQYPVELCGGTHLSNTGEAERFVLISEEGAAKGVRRVVGITGEAAHKAEAYGVVLRERLDALRSHPPDDLAERVAAFQRDVAESVIPIRVRHELQTGLAELQKAVKEAQKQQAAASGEAVRDRVAELLDRAETVGGVTVVVGEVPPAAPDALRGAIDWIRKKTEASAVLLATASEGKVILIAGMSKAAVAKGLHAGDLIKHIAPIVGGKGGGRPDMAQGGGDKPDAVSEVVKQAREWIHGKLGTS